MIPLTSGSRLGNFQILERVGSGGMGDVYRARDIRLRREVAIKVLPARLDGDADALTRFGKEALALAQLSHPNILSIFDVGTEAGMTYTVMELLQGETLRERIARGPMSWQEVVEIALPIAEGLAAAHRKGIVHRDLKPSNVFLTGEGRVKVVDFGLARLEEAAAVDSATATLARSPVGDHRHLVGTVGYIPPEQLLDQPVDTRGDLFSFGCLLWEMLTGRRAFARRSVPSTLLAIVSDDLPALGDEVRDAPVALTDLVDRCLRKDPAARPQSTDEVVGVLRALEQTSRSIPLHPELRPRRRLRRSLLAAALAVVVSAGAWWLWPVAEAEPRSPSVAVLPLANLDDSPGGEYFSDGMTEDVIARLSRVRDLRVISRATAARYKERQDELAPTAIAEELGVATILRGSVRRDGDEVRVVAELVDGKSGETLWVETYDRRMDDLFTVQSEVAERIALALASTLAPAEQARLRQHPTADLDAYRSYLRGRYFWNRRTEEDIARAVDAYERAIERDPSFALAYAGLADAYALQPAYGFADDPDEAYERARRAARRALELDPSLAEAHATLGYVEFFHDWDMAAAEADFRRALLLDPSSPTARHWYAQLLNSLGRPAEALREIRRALAVDPFAPAIRRTAAWILMSNGQLVAAERLLREALEDDPRHPNTHHQLAVVHMLAGDGPAALTAIHRELAVSGSDRGINDGFLAVLEARFGDPAAAAAIVEDLEQRHADPEGEVSPYWIGLGHAALGHEDRVFAWLETAFAERDVWLLGLASERLLAPLRDRPRYLDLARRVYGDAWARRLGETSGGPA